MKAELVTITPQWAQEVLHKRNTNNRPLSTHHVESLAREMRCGRWKINGDTICLNGNQLIDGQHRLAAVVASGVTIQSWLIDGLPSDVFDTKDVGKRRSGGDTLGMRGEHNAYRLAAALVLIDAYMTGRGDKSVTYTNTEIQGLLNKYPDARLSLKGSNHLAKGLILPSIVDACHYIFSQKDRRLADEFVEKVLKGTDLQAGSPWHVLRERLVRNRMSKAKLSKRYVMALCIKAWNYARLGKDLRNLRWRETGDCTEAFPVAI